MLCHKPDKISFGSQNGIVKTGELKMAFELQLPEIISIILGALVPILIEPLKKFFATRVKRFFASLGLSIFIGGIAFFVTNPTVADLADTIVYVFGFSQLAYNAFRKKLWEVKK